MFRPTHEALLPGSDLTLEERAWRLAIARDALVHSYKTETSERKIIERLRPASVTDPSWIYETIVHHIEGLTVAMQDLNHPRARCTAGFYGSLSKYD